MNISEYDVIFIIDFSRKRNILFGKIIIISFLTFYLLIFLK